MSMTETRPEAAEEADAPAARAAPAAWFTSVDHKRVGVAYLYTALAFAAACAVGELGAGIERFGDGMQLVDGGDLRLVTLGLLGFWLFLLPAFIGLATHLVPLQIGARGIALPRLHLFAYWLYAAGGVVTVASYLVDGGPTVDRSLVVAPEGIRGGDADQLWILGLAMVAAASLVAAAGLIATICTRRAPGLTFDRLAPFTWSALVGSAVVAFATPVFGVGLALLSVEANDGAGTFARAAGDDLWQHVLWLHGRPELLALLVFGAGVVSEVVVTAARRRLMGSHVAVLGLLAAAGALSFGVWMSDQQSAAAPLAPTFNVPAALVYAPIGLLGLVWLGTLATGRPRVTAALVHALGVVVVLGVGLAGAVSAFVVDVRSGTEWAAGHLGIVLFAPSVLALVAGVHHWAPKIWGRHLNEPLGFLTFLALLVGSLAWFGPSYLGLRDFPRFSLETGGDFTDYNRIATIGAFVTAAGLVLLAVNIALSVWGRRGRAADADAWGAGATLEWAAASPPPPMNFESGAVPAVHSPHPLLDTRAEGAA